MASERERGSPMAKTKRFDEKVSNILFVLRLIAVTLLLIPSTPFALLKCLVEFPEF
jgi:hypothetical protein